MLRVQLTNGADPESETRIMGTVLRGRTDVQGSPCFQSRDEAGGASAHAGGGECERAGAGAEAPAQAFDAWRDNFRAGGPEALRTRGRPRKSAPVALPEAGAPPVSAPAMAELAKAKQRVAELERKIGQQQVELDFFSASLAASKSGESAGRATGLARRRLRPHAGDDDRCRKASSRSSACARWPA